VGSVGAASVTVASCPASVPPSPPPLLELLLLEPLLLPLLELLLLEPLLLPLLELPLLEPLLLPLLELLLLELLLVATSTPPPSSLPAGLSVDVQAPLIATTAPNAKAKHDHVRREALRARVMCTPHPRPCAWMRTPFTQATRFRMGRQARACHPSSDVKYSFCDG
jgi:hypothetical protein